MKMLASILSAVTVMLFAAMAGAGVVVDEQQTIEQPGGKKMVRARSVMIEGDKQKSIIDDGKRIVITDLGKGTMIMVDPAQKAYVEFPFPPSGSPSAMQGAISPTITFKKTGAHDTIIGYSCDEYSGTGSIGVNTVIMSGCFSDSAPGATDYSNFQREMAEKVKGTPVANMGQIPPGVPLRLIITTTMGNASGGARPADPASKLNQTMSNHQIVTNTTVSKISPKSLPPDSFQVPAGYNKQQLPPMYGGTGSAAPPAASAPSKVPE